MDLATLDMHIKFIYETLANEPIASSIMKIGSSNALALVNYNTSKTLQTISTALNDIKGDLSSINVMNNAKQSGGYRLRKTQRKSQKTTHRTRKH
jgi:hypothetical protein